MNTRNWPIRSKIIALVAAPVAALLALWIFATTLTVGPASDLLQAQTVLNEVGRPGETLVAELQRERRASLVHLSGPDDAAALSAQRTRTDRAIAEFRRRTAGSRYSDYGNGTFSARLAEMMTALETLPAGRGRIDRRELDNTRALALYSGILNRALRTFAAMVVHAGDQELTREAQALIALTDAREVLEQGDALLAGAFAAGRLGEGEYSQLVQIIGTHRYLYTAAVADLPRAGQSEYRRLTEGDAFVRLRAMEQDVIDKGRDGAALPIDRLAWQSSFETARQQLRDFNLSSSDSLTERSKPVAITILIRLGLAGVLGFLAVLVSIFIGVRVGRSLVRRLTGLRTAAEQMATERLPAVVTRLRRGEEVDIASETRVLDYGADEIGQVGRAFNAVQQTAVRSAVDEAALRRGLNDVFLNIARRSQTLLHRQLALLDKMERRTTEPSELEDLFRVDHLATRMRRHAEDLVILAGAAPGRGWRNPVPMVDVVRGAISEVEEYHRVDIGGVQPAACVGRAVGDLVHLLAELIENATSFSPPHTRVRVGGQAVPNGYAIEVEDRGLGMTVEALTEANRRLTDPPDFDPANSARLGLFVVAQLGARHNLRVQLRPSPYGGVTAVVLIPADLISSGAGRVAVPGASESAVESTALAPGTDLSRARTLRRAPSQLLLPPAPPAESPEQPPPAAESPEQPASAEVRSDDGTDGGGADGGGAGTGEEPAAGRRSPSFADAPTAVLPVVPAGPAGTIDPAAPPTEDGLPRRIRQTSLAPQLRAAAGARTTSAEPASRQRPATRPTPVTRPTPAAPGRSAGSSGRSTPAAGAAGAGGEGGGEGDEGAATETPPVRNPDEVRAVMAALQAGTARGRREAGTPDDPADASPVTDRDSTDPGRDA